MRRLKARSAAALGVFALLLAGCNRTAEEPAERGPLSGEELYALWCADCHDPGPGHPGTLRLEGRLEGDEAVLAKRANDPDVVRFAVRNGFGMMPPFRATEITDEELERIVDHLAEPRP